MGGNTMSLLRIFTGPALYKRYKSESDPGRVYEANFFEAKADSALWAATALRTFCLYLSPLIASYLYSRGYLSTPGSLGKVAFYVGSFYTLVYLMRGAGRLMNSDYTAFLKVLSAANAQPSPANIRALREFDSEFWAWPVMYRCANKTTDGEDIKLKSLPLELPERGTLNPLLWQVHGWLCWFAAHTFAGWMMYPGHLRLYNILLQDTLSTKRKELVEKYDGARTKLLTRNNLELDTMFVERRNRREFPLGNTLVITCEGNAGFYEIGCMETGLGKGFSVLGWNHPGFGGSTGTPWPGHDAEAVATVVQYAVRGLGFREEDILLFAWSIGGFSATAAAMNHPNVSGLVLDATFDDLVPLALPRMPAAWDGLVRRTVRAYWDLPILRQLLKFQGPVTIIRRTKDEIIVSDESTPDRQLKTNRSKQLLLGLLRFRFPALMESADADAAVTELFDNPPRRAYILSEAGNMGEARRMLESLVTRRPNPDSQLFPLDHIGPQLTPRQQRQMILFLASEYMVDFESVHCNPLPTHLLNVPKHPWEA